MKKNQKNQKKLTDKQLFSLIKYRHFQDIIVGDVNDILKIIKSYSGDGTVKGLTTDNGEELLPDNLGIITLPHFLISSDLINYYNKTQIDSQISAINTRIGNLGSDLASVQSDVSYLNENAATKSELSNYQLAESVNLQTNSNSIVGAINETYDSIKTVIADLTINWNSAVVDTTQNNTISGEWKGKNVIAIRGRCHILNTLYISYSSIFQLGTNLSRKPFNNPTGSYAALPSWINSGIIKRGTSAYLCAVFIDDNGNLNFCTVNNISDGARELEFYFLMETV